MTARSTDLVPTMLRQAPTLVPRPAQSGWRGGGAGLWLAVLSVAACSTSGTLGKALYAIGWSPGAAILVRLGGGTLLLAVPAALALRGRWHVLRDHLGLVVAFGVVAVACSQLFYFQAVARSSVGVALLLEYLAPVVVVAWLWATTRRRPSALTMLGSLVAVAGLVLVVDAGSSATVDVVGVAWGLGAAACLAAYFVLAARPADDLPPVVLVAGGMAVGTAVLGAAALLGLLSVAAPVGDVPMGSATVTWLVPAVGLALVPGAIGYTTGVVASRRLGARVTAFVSLVEVAFALALAWAWLGEVPTSVQWLGGLVLVGGIVAIRVDEFRVRRPTSRPTVASRV